MRDELADPPAWVKVYKSVAGDDRKWTPAEVMTGFTVLQLQALASPDGKISKEQALDILNDRRGAKGLEPLSGIP